MFLICSASRICSFCLLFWCSNIVVLSVGIFRNCVIGHECFFKCWAIELVLERCIVSLLNRVVEVKPTYISLLSEIIGVLKYFSIKSQFPYFCWCWYILGINGSWVPSWENLFVVEINYSPRDWYIYQYYLE